MDWPIDIHLEAKRNSHFQQYNKMETHIALKYIKMTY